MLCSLFFFLFISLQDFFFLKKVSCVYIYRMYLHLHCGYCCNSSIWSCKALKCCKLYKIMLYKNMLFGGGGFILFSSVQFGHFGCIDWRGIFYYKISYYKTLFGDFKQSCLWFLIGEFERILGRTLFFVLISNKNKQHLKNTTSKYASR